MTETDEFYMNLGIKPMEPMPEPPRLVIWPFPSVLGLFNFVMTGYESNTPPQPAQEPVSAKDWEGAEYWMPLAWELCAEELGEDACNEMIWGGGPIPEPWGEQWLTYKDEAKRLIAMVQKNTPPQPAQEPVKEKNT
jgi:hypothetical protein